MYAELFADLKSNKNKLSKEEYKECYNSIKEAKLNSDYLNLNNTNSCRCYQGRNVTVCDLNNLMYCNNRESFIKRIPFIEYFLHDMNEFLNIKLMDNLEIKKEKMNEISFDTYIGINKYLLRNFETLCREKKSYINMKKKFIYIIGLFNFLLEHSYNLYNIKATIDINKNKKFVDAIYHKIIDIKLEMDENYKEHKLEHIDMYDDTISNIINKQYELIKIIYDYYSEIETPEK